MHYEDAVKRMTALVYPYVKKTLDEEAQTADIGAIAEVLEMVGFASGQVTPDELVPDSAEIRDYSVETGRLVVSAWWQFLGFLLQQQPTVPLDVDLLPDGPVPEDYWEAFNSCMVSCPFNQGDLRSVFHQFAQSLGPQESVQLHDVQITREQERFVAHL